MISFLETPRFPDDISYGSLGGPAFKTLIFEGHSGTEQRDMLWSESKAKWNVSHGVRDKSDMDLLRAFFYEVRGRAVGFRFKDWGDYELAQEKIGTGNGVLATYNIIKTYGTTNPYVRRILKPIDNAAFIVRVNNVVMTEGVGTGNYAVNYTTGVITFGTALIPPNGQIIDVSGEYDVPVRFDVDEMAAAHDGFLTETWGGIGIEEIQP